MPSTRPLPMHLLRGALTATGLAACGVQYASGSGTTLLSVIAPLSHPCLTTTQRILLLEWTPIRALPV